MRHRFFMRKPIKEKPLLLRMSKALSAIHLFLFEHQLIRLQPLNASINLLRAPTLIVSQHQLGESTNFQILQAPTCRLRHKVSPSTTLPPLFSILYKESNYSIQSKHSIICTRHKCFTRKPIREKPLLLRMSSKLQLLYISYSLSTKSNEAATSDYKHQLVESTNSQ